MASAPLQRPSLNDQWIKLGNGIEYSINWYERTDVIGTGATGSVYKAMDTRTGEIVAMKKLRVGLSKAALREIDILQSLRGHSSIVEIKRVVEDEKRHIFIVMEYVENNLNHYIYATKTTLNITFVKWIMIQLLEGVAFIHNKGVIHRDLKPENILLSKRGELKLCDFGLSQRSNWGSRLKHGTLWYKASELLMETEKNYSSAVDMWSVGCIMVEMLTRRTIFAGCSEIDQLYAIFGILGMPQDVNVPGIEVKFVGPQDNVLWERVGGGGVVSKVGLDLMNKLLAYELDERITAAEALNHAWFKEG